MAKYEKIFLKHPYIFWLPTWTMCRNLVIFLEIFGNSFSKNHWICDKNLQIFSPKKEAESNSLYEFYNEYWIAINYHHTQKSLGILAQVLKTLLCLNVETLTLKHWQIFFLLGQWCGWRVISHYAPCNCKPKFPKQFVFQTFAIQLFYKWNTSKKWSEYGNHHA